MLLLINHSKEEVHLSYLILARSVGHKPESHSNCEFVQRCNPARQWAKLPVFRSVITSTVYLRVSSCIFVYLGVLNGNHKGTVWETFISESDLDHQILVRLSSRFAWNLKWPVIGNLWPGPKAPRPCRSRNCEVIPLLGNHHVIWHRLSAGYHQAPLYTRLPRWDITITKVQLTTYHWAKQSGIGQVCPANRWHHLWNKKPTKQNHCLLCGASNLLLLPNVIRKQQ